MYPDTIVKIRLGLAFFAIFVGLLAATTIISPAFSNSILQRYFGLVAGRESEYQSLFIVGCILCVTCIPLLSLMLPETKTIDASMAEIAEKIAEPGSLVAGIEREVASNLDRIITILKNHSEVSRIYSVSLENAGRNLIELTSPEQLRVAIGYLITENNKMRRETGSLQSHLKESHLKIENLRENLEVAEETGMRDSLTSLWNRRAFDKMLAMQVETAPQKNAPLCLILADIDHFKRINDNFGHLIGDEILRLVASTISKNVKGRDFVSRFGGEEFALILPQTSLENALKLAMQIKHQLEIQKWVISRRNEALGAITASFGVAQLQPGELKEGFLVRTDKRLYDAKAAGRNRVSC
jgi:diguanylate cyclase